MFGKYKNSLDEVFPGARWFSLLGQAPWVPVLGLHPLLVISRGARSGAEAVEGLSLLTSHYGKF